jgi:hypothetical protein
MTNIQTTFAVFSLQVVQPTDINGISSDYRWYKSGTSGSKNNCKLTFSTKGIITGYIKKIQIDF